MMDISGERAGTERRDGSPSDREAGEDSCALQARGDARAVLTGTGAHGRAAISVYTCAAREMGQPANVAHCEALWSCVHGAPLKRHGGHCRTVPRTATGLLGEEPLVDV